MWEGGWRGKFKSHDGLVGVANDDGLVWSGSDSFLRCIYANFKRDYEIVKESVPIAKAIEALKNGKTVSCEPGPSPFQNCTFTNNTIKVNNIYNDKCRDIAVRDILYGKWYIED